MENTGSIISLLLLGAVVGYFAWRIGKEREKLRETLRILEDPEDRLVGSLEALLHSGKLTPVTASQ